MKRPLLLVAAVFAVSFETFAQTPAGTADDNVVAIVDGHEWKKSELERLVRSLSPQIAQNYYANKRGFIETFALMSKLSTLAESEGLDKKDPHYFRLYYNRLLYLAQVRIDSQNTRQQVMPDDQKKYYEEHKGDYSQAKVKVLFLGFNDKPMAAVDPKAKKPLTGAEAEKLATDIVKQARAGTDFVQLVQKYSDDPDSKAKGGDFPPMKPSDNNLPAQIKSAVFALKPGQVSDPIRQAGGFWIFRMTEFITPPYDDVKDDIFKAIQDLRLTQWIDNFKKTVAVEFKDPKYLDEKSPAR